MFFTKVSLADTPEVVLQVKIVRQRIPCSDIAANVIGPSFRMQKVCARAVIEPNS